MYPSKIPFSGYLEDVCGHTHKPDKNLHPEKFTYTTADTQKRIHSVMDTEIHTIIYTQNHVHSITDTEIHIIVGIKIHTHIHRNRYTKRATHIPMQTQTKRNSTRIHTNSRMPNTWTLFVLPLLLP